MHEQQSRPRTTEHTISARKHDIYLSFDDEDREDASNMHAILRRMGYIVYSTVGQIRVRKATSGTADVRPLCVKFQKNEELAGNHDLLTRNHGVCDHFDTCKHKWPALAKCYRLAAFSQQPSTFNPQPSTLDPRPSTLNPRPSTLDHQPSTLNPQPSTLDPRPSTW